VAGHAIDVLIADVVRGVLRSAEAPDANPFDAAEYEANVAAGADWEVRQGVRKALRLLTSGAAEDALRALDRLLTRLPAGPAHGQVADLAARLRATRAAAAPPPAAARGHVSRPN
jgi:hypothetical protein